MSSIQRQTVLQSAIGPAQGKLGLPAYILIIGAMKSGTTTLFQHLANHPEICPSTPKEPGYFATEECWAMGPVWYDSLFEFDSSRHAFALDGSTDYSKFPFCSGIGERIKNSTPAKFKMIYIMRHPLRRIESHAKWVARTGREVWRIDSPRTDHSLDAGISPVSLAISRYASQLDQYKEFIEQGDILLLTMEELKQNPVVTLQRVFEYLGVDSKHEIDTDSIQNEGRSQRTTINPMWSAAVEVPGLKPIVKAIVPKSLRNFLKNTTSVTTNIQGRFELLPSEEEELLDLLKDDLKRLRDHYGVDINQWWSIDI